MKGLVCLLVLFFLASLAGCKAGPPIPSGPPRQPLPMPAPLVRPAPVAPAVAPALERAERTKALAGEFQAAVAPVLDNAASSPLSGSQRLSVSAFVLDIYSAAAETVEEVRRLALALAAHDVEDERTLSAADRKMMEVTEAHNQSVRETEAERAGRVKAEVAKKKAEDDLKSARARYLPLLIVAGILIAAGGVVLLIVGKGLRFLGACVLAGGLAVIGLTIAVGAVLDFVALHPVWSLVIFVGLAGVVSAVTLWRFQAIRAKEELAAEAARRRAEEAARKDAETALTHVAAAVEDVDPNSTEGLKSAIEKSAKAAGVLDVVKSVVRKVKSAAGIGGGK